MCIKSILVIFSVAVAATAYADIVEPEVLHRIGYEVLVAAAGAAALGGGLIRKLRNGSKNDKKEHWKDEYEVSPAERDDIKRRIDENLPFVQGVFDRAYERALPMWMREDKEKVPRYTFAYWVGRAREDVWCGLQEQLLMDVLARDNALLERFRGVPIEWLRNRLAKPMPDDFTAGVFARGETEVFAEMKAELGRRNRAMRIRRLWILAAVIVSICAAIGLWLLW